MKLFRSEKKEETCSCGGSCNVSNTEKESAVKVLGSGCAKCIALEKSAIEALDELGKEPYVQHVTDFVEISKYGVMQTPALVVDGKVVSYGKVLSKNEVMKLLTN